MELTMEEIKREIAGLEAQRQQFIEQSNRQVAEYNGAIQVWRQLLERLITAKQDAA